MKRKIVQPVIAAVVHFLICILSGSLGWDKQTVIVPVASILAMVFANRKAGLSPVLSLLIVLPFYAVYISTSLIVGAEYATYPIWIFGILASLFTFILLQYRVNAVTSIAVLAVLVLFDGLVAWPNTFAWLYMENKPSERNVFTAKITDNNNREISMESLKGKVVLFDLWNSACYPCIKKFPELQALHDRYSNDSSVRIISLNIPLERDKGIRPSRFTDPYSFEKMYFSDSTEYHKFSQRELPLVLILDKNLQCRYSGQLHTGWNIFIGNAWRIINQLKNE